LGGFHPHATPHTPTAHPRSRPHPLRTHLSQENKKTDGDFDLKALPERLQTQLAVFDADGDGSLSAAELIRAVELYKASLQKLKNMTYLVIGLVIAMIVVCGVAFGLTFASSLASIKATKDVQAATTALTDTASNTLRTAAAAIAASGLVIPSGGRRLESRRLASGGLLAPSSVRGARGVCGVGGRRV